MRRLLTIALMLAAGSLAACSDDAENNDVLGVPLPGANALDVRIVGPQLLHEQGEYRWTAEIIGADGESAEYRWDVIWPGADELHRTVNGATLDLFVAAERQAVIELHVHAAANGRLGTTSTLVTICPGSMPLPIDDCGNVLSLDR